jgi:hypothetical protein
MAGFLYPVRQSQHWALDLIAQKIGLSYETALEHEDSSNYGFKPALEEYASKAVKRLEPASFRRWWLPLLVVAFSLTLLPVSPFRSSPRLIGVPDSLNPFANETTVPNEQTTPPNEPESQATEVQPPNTQPDTPSAETGSPQTLDDASGTSGEGLSDISQNVADKEALSRFLENLREREIPNEPATDAPTPNTPQPNNANGQPNEEGTTQTQDASQSENASAEQGGQQENAGESTGEQNAQSATENAQGENPEGSDSSDQAGNNNEAQANEQGLNSSGEKPDSDGPSQNSPNQSADEGSDGSGNMPSASSQSQGLNGEGQRQEPEFLEGSLSRGDSNLAGTVRLPGSSEQEAGNFGVTPSGFQRAEEQAVTEGRIPIEYQEIVKNYFR